MQAGPATNKPPAGTTHQGFTRISPTQRKRPPPRSGLLFTGSGSNQPEIASRARLAIVATLALLPFLLAVVPRPIDLAYVLFTPTDQLNDSNHLTDRTGEFALCFGRGVRPHSEVDRIIWKTAHGPKRGWGQCLDHLRKVRPWLSDAIKARKPARLSRRGTSSRRWRR
jgi:hypothetical protein